MQKLISTLSYLPLSGILNSGRLSYLFLPVLYFQLPSLIYKLLLYIQVNPQYSQAIMVSSVVLRESLAEPWLETGSKVSSSFRASWINASNNCHDKSIMILFYVLLRSEGKRNRDF